VIALLLRFPLGIWRLAKTAGGITLALHRRDGLMAQSNVAKVRGVSSSEAAAAIVERLTGIASASEGVDEAVSNVLKR